MKHLAFLIIISVSLLTTSCYKHWHYDFEEIEYGFESEIHAYSKELVLMKTNDEISNIHLNGSVELSCGNVEITLIQPNDEIVFYKSISGNVQLELNEIFPAQKGYWKLKYESNEGKGFINLHLNQ